MADCWSNHICVLLGTSRYIVTHGATFKFEHLSGFAAESKILCDINEGIPGGVDDIKMISLAAVPLKFVGCLFYGTILFLVFYYLRSTRWWHTHPSRHPPPSPAALIEIIGPVKKAFQENQISKLMHQSGKIFPPFLQPLFHQFQWFR